MYYYEVAFGTSISVTGCLMYTFTLLIVMIIT